MRFFQRKDSIFYLVELQRVVSDDGRETRMRLFCRNYTCLDKPGDAHRADVKTGSGLGLSDPAVCVLRVGTVRGNAAFLSEGSHSTAVPSFSSRWLDVFSIEHGGDRCISEYFAERVAEPSRWA